MILGSQVRVRRLAWRALLAALLVSVVGAAVWFFWSAAIDARFDRQRWLSDKGDGWDGPRSRMVGSLVDQHLKPGARREQVRLLLGEPDGSSQADTENNIDAYQLGHIGWFGIDGSYLWIHYDKAGRIASVEWGES